VTARRRHALYYLSLVRSGEGDWQRVEREIGEIRRAWRWVSTESGDQELTLEYAQGLRGSLETRGLWREAVEWQERALGAARTLKRDADRAALLVNAGWAWNAVGDRRKALSRLRQALTLARRIGDRDHEGAALNSLGAVSLLVGNTQAALEHFEAALRLRAETGDLQGEAMVSLNIGQAQRQLGQHQEALASFEKALPILVSVGDQAHRATCLNNIAGALYAMNRQGRGCRLLPSRPRRAARHWRSTRRGGDAQQPGCCVLLSRADGGRAQPVPREPRRGSQNGPPSGRSDYLEQHRGHPSALWSGLGCLQVLSACA